MTDAETDAQRLERIINPNTASGDEWRWLLAQAAESQALRAALEDATDYLDAFAGVAPYPDATLWYVRDAARRALERKP